MPCFRFLNARDVRDVVLCEVYDTHREPSDAPLYSSCARTSLDMSDYNLPHASGSYLPASEHGPTSRLPPQSGFERLSDTLSLQIPQTQTYASPGTENGLGVFGWPDSGTEVARPSFDGPMLKLGEPAPDTLHTPVSARFPVQPTQSPARAHMMLPNYPIQPIDVTPSRRGSLARPSLQDAASLMSPGLSSHWRAHDARLSIHSADLPAPHVNLLDPQKSFAPPVPPAYTYAPLDPAPAPPGSSLPTYQPEHDIFRQPAYRWAGPEASGSREPAVSIPAVSGSRAESSAVHRLDPEAMSQVTSRKRSRSPDDKAIDAQPALKKQRNGGSKGKRMSRSTANDLTVLSQPPQHSEQGESGNSVPRGRPLGKRYNVPKSLEEKRAENNKDAKRRRDAEKKHINEIAGILGVKDQPSQEARLEEMADVVRRWDKERLDHEREKEDSRAETRRLREYVQTLESMLKKNADEHVT
ncbi:hypothetical protein FA95DRAFT_1560677 [Auriscalpium vulgare]|uniref:Uncharacterized protein n=1 Tax=Auriscalpium vulgare TaxID=40419 RepID=A0ACB8RP62_9AGAM|nr:hypothetical protein FA95DRAFT_1560677 [Auriscalpium vulgare]